MKVYFLRHGKAENRAEWRGRDADRPLTPEGEEIVRREAEALRAMDLAPDVIVTSPLARARRTAEIVADGLGLGGRLVEDERLAPGFDVARLEQVLAAHASGARAVLVVGHEPDFSETVAALIGGGDVVMKKGGLARVDVAAPAAGGGRLDWLLTPSLLGGR
jgi:phosphohistidine phosphatase